MPMRFRILGSGSSGNAALLITEGARVLVDAGFSAKKLSVLLLDAGERSDGVVMHETSLGRLGAHVVAFDP